MIEKKEIQMHFIVGVQSHAAYTVKAMQIDWTMTHTSFQRK